MTTTKDRYHEIAQTIKQQISVGRIPLPLLVGANSFVFLNSDSLIIPGEKIAGGLMFKVRSFMGQDVRGVKVIIELNHSDTYDVVIGRQRGIEWKVSCSHAGLYCDQLGEIIADDLGVGDCI